MIISTQRHEAKVATEEYYNNNLCVLFKLYISVLKKNFVNSLNFVSLC